MLHYKNTNSFSILFLLFLLSIIIFASCSRQSETKDIVISFKDIPQSHIRLDTTVFLANEIPLIVGTTKPIKSGYMMYLYDNDNFICLTDTSFKINKMAVPRGNGRAELTGVSGKFGQSLESGDSIVSVFNSGKSTVYALNINNGSLEEYIQFPNIMSRYMPFSVTKLKNGEFISPRGDFKYGMVAYNPEKNVVEEWPIGLESIDVNNPEEKHVNLRAYDYNKNSGLIAEIYGLIPTIVIHDELGNVIRTITIDGVPKEKENSEDYFHDICMTDDYIFVLCGDPSVDESNFVVVLTHTGTPVTSYKIRPTQTITADLSTSKLITTNPNIDEGNIAVYGPIEYIHRKSQH